MSIFIQQAYYGYSDCQQKTHGVLVRGFEYNLCYSLLGSKHSAKSSNGTAIKTNAVEFVGERILSCHAKSHGLVLDALDGAAKRERKTLVLDVCVDLATILCLSCLCHMFC